MNWAVPKEQSVKKMPPAHAQGQSDGGESLVEVPSSQVVPVCVNLRKTKQHVALASDASGLTVGGGYGGAVTSEDMRLYPSTVGWAQREAGVSLVPATQPA